MRSVLLNALPGGLVNVVNLLAVMWIGSGMGLPMEQISTVCTLLAGTAGFMVLLFLCWPLSRWRFAIVAAMGVGFIGACVLLGPLFGLSPLDVYKRQQQKRALICALKDTGRTVAMIGDGVNDVLALKDADCSIAMAAGSEAAQHVAQLVLLSSNFSAMRCV